jgi:signal transduction histidine kinase
MSPWYLALPAVFSRWKPGLCKRLGLTRRWSMKFVTRPARLLSALVALGILVGPALAAKEDAYVLILNGYDPYLPANLMMDSGMRANLANETARRIVLYSESLDAGRVTVESRDTELVALFTKKYSAQRIDVVVTVTKPALDFFKRHGEQLWPGARLVFHGIPDPADEAVPIPPGAVGIINQDDVGGTIDIARRLQPTAHRILFIGGVGPGDLQVERRVRRLAPTGAGTLNTEFVSGLPLPELLTRVASEPADTIIVFLTLFLDRDGRSYRPPDVAQVLSSVSAAPVYSLYENNVDRGVAAGSVVSYEDRGRLVGQLVRETLAGTHFAGGSVFTIASRCVANARALHRWSLDAERLPAGCDVRFADRPYWKEYLWQIVTGLAVIVAQALLISALLVQRRRRRVAEQAVQKHRQEVAHASRLAVAGELTASIAHEINQPLGAILNNVDAADLLIASGNAQDETLREILADIRRDDVRASEVIRRLRALLAKHEIQRSPLDVNTTVAEVASLLRVEAEHRGVRIEMRLAPRATIVGDRVQIAQVLINLLLNAMDALSDEGEDRRTITIEVEEAEHRVRIAIRDRGRGIGPEALPRVFDSFYSTKHAGMGLGLSIARTIVEAHGGRIWVESRAGDGTAFFIELPSIVRADDEARTVATA